MAQLPEQKALGTDSKDGAAVENAAPAQSTIDLRTPESVQSLSAAEMKQIADSKEVDRAVENVERRRKAVSKTVKMVMTASTVIGAAVPLLMFKNSQGWQKWAKRGATAVVTGMAGGIIGGMASSAMMTKGDFEKYDELNKAENDVIKRYRASQHVTPRDASHAAQVAKEPAQPGTPAIGA